MPSKFDPTAPVVVNPPAIVASDLTRAEQVCNDLISLDRTLITTQFEIGDLFAEAEDGDYLRADHCETRADFLKKHNLKISEREILYQVNISRKCQKLGITNDQRVKAKVSKMKIICELNPDDEVTNPSTGAVEKVGDIMKALVDSAATKPMKEIRKAVNDLKGKTQGEDSVLEWWNLPVFKSRRDFMEDTVQIAIKLSGDTVDPNSKEAVDVSRATAIERLFADWRSDPNNQVDEGDTPVTKTVFEDEHFYQEPDGTLYESA